MMKMSLSSLRKLIFIALSFLPVYGFTQVIRFNWPETAPESEYYDVKVYYDDQEFDLFTHITKPNLKVDPAHPNEGDGVTGFLEDRSMSYVQFDFFGEITIEVTKLYGTKAPRVVISPKTFGINPTYFDGRTVRFNISSGNDIPRYLSVNFDCADNKDPDTNGGQNILNGMMIFADEPERSQPDPDAPGVVVYSKTANLDNADIIYFPAGDWDLTERFNTDPGNIGRMPYTKNGQRIYLEGGAFVRGAFHGKGHDNIWLYGRGIISGEDFAWHWFRDEQDKKDAFINLMGCDNVHIEGISIVNPTHHAIPSGQDSYIRNLKILGWASNHDGIRPSSGSYVDGIFIKTSDDNNYARNDHDVVNSIFWPMTNGATGQLGWNNLGDGYATFRNCILINSEWRDYNRNRGLIASVLEQGVQQQRDTLDNIVCEDYTGLLANITIQYETNGDPLNQGAGEIHDFVFRNIKMEQPFLYPSGVQQKQPISGFVEGSYKAMIHDIKFINLVAGNTLVTQENHTDYFDLDPETTYNITFETEGEIHSLYTSSNEGGQIVPSGDIPVPDGTRQYVEIIPDDGYKISDVLIDSVSMGRMQVVAFDEVTRNHTIQVVFEEGDDFFDLLSTGKNPVPAITSPPLIYPNPASEMLIMEWEKIDRDTSVQLMFLDGRVISSVPAVRTNPLTIPVSNLAEGLYILKVRSSVGKHLERILITR